MRIVAWGLGLISVVGGLVGGVTAEQRHAGRIQEIDPAGRRMVLEEIGLAGRVEQVEIDLSGARVLRVFRDPQDPWRWREEPTRLERFPTGTYVVVIGSTVDGRLAATRVEVPRVDVDR